MTRRALTLITGPASEPVTLSEVKSWLRIDYTADDTMLTSLITSARQAVEEYLRRSLITQTWKIAFDAPCSGFGNYLGEGIYDLPISILSGYYPRRFELPKGPVQSITSFVTNDTSNQAATFANTNYILTDTRVTLNDTAVLPTNLRPSAGIEITYVAGYGANASDVPSAIRTAITMTVGVMYDSRGTCDDADIPPGAKRLLNAYRIRDELVNG